ncbi:alpha/beta fold hydrolase [Actinospica durhamensis]|uniref:Alpha/beta fold hydrolase n=1 Tax=Actinospica durhamensis TaxID=1508375 RepID=A0A941ITX1_9ACTN|nr:alpha/beta hydrolase [Actinospica durhamensis]MBR7838227.1 alpha/beta fold hydrolase [Actinospica durhamensis]
MSETSTPSGTPTVVLVHGAFADAASWAHVTERLAADGVAVRAIVNPLRGISHDAAYVASMINQIPGPVLAVGHSYGGAVITNAVPHTGNVVGLVYVAAFAPDEGEVLGDIVARSKDSVLTTALEEYEFPVGDGTATEVLIEAAKFRAVFTADLPQLQSDVYGSPSVRSPPVRSPRRAAPRPGRTCPSGRPSVPPTPLPAATSSGRWPSVREPTSPRSRARTSS